MSDDLALQMYDVQAQLIEIKEELGKIQKENDALKNQMAANNLMKTDDDHAKLSETVGAIQVNVTTLSTKVSRSDQILSGINETIRKQSETLITRAEAFNKLNEMKETIEQQNEVIETLKKNRKTIEKETILVLGGWSEGKKMDSLLILQNNGEDDGNWKELNIKLPYALWCHGAQFLNNTLYIFGGENEKDEVLNSTYKLTRGHKWITNNLKWEKMADMSEKRTAISNSSVILNDRIWVVGGKDERWILKSVEMYDPQTNIWTNMKEMNQCRSVAAAASINGKIFCCGGMNGKTRLKSAECYDSSSNVWTLISEMPKPNIGCGIVVMDAHLIVIGGMASVGKDVLDSVWVLDTADKNAEWLEKEPCLSRPLCYFSIAKIDDKIFVCGGARFNKEDSTLRNLNDVEIFDGEVWRNGPKMPIYVSYAPAAVVSMEFTRYLN